VSDGGALVAVVRFERMVCICFAGIFCGSVEGRDEVLVRCAMEMIVVGVRRWEGRIVYW